MKNNQELPSKVKNLKVYGKKILKLSAPFVIIATIGIVPAAYLHNCGYICNSSTRTEYDSFGNTSTEETFDNFSDDSSYLRYYDSWEHDGDGSYCRKITQYYLPEKYYDDINDLLHTDESELAKIFNKPSFIVERKDSLNVSDQSGPFIEVVAYDLKKGSKMIKKISTSDSVMLAVSIMGIIMVGTAIGRTMYELEKNNIQVKKILK